MRKVRPFACKRIRNYAASGSTDSIEEDCGGGGGGGASPEHHAPAAPVEEAANRAEEENINRSVREHLNTGHTRLRCWHCCLLWLSYKSHSL